MHAVMHSLSDYQHFALIVNNSFIFFVSYGGDFIQLVSLFVQAESKKRGASHEVPLSVKESL